MRTAVTAGALAVGATGLAAGSLYVVQGGEASGGSAKNAALAGDTARGRASQPPGGGGPDGGAGAAAARLVRQLGARTSGAYLDASGRPVVTVTNAADAAMVRAAGVTPRMSVRSPETLRGITKTLRRTMAVPGTGWTVDPATSRVVMWTDGTVTGTRLAAVHRMAARMGPAVRMVRVPGRLSTLARGADAIFGQGVRCSLGFNVKRGQESFFLTAGHCGNVVKNWTADQQGAQALGTTVTSSFPGNDFALVRSEDGAAGEGEVNLFNGQTRDITQAGDAVVGQRVTRSGSTSGAHSGQVTAVDATVNFPEGTVTGMIQTTVCAEPGDSGGPLFAGTTALGLTSGGSGDCQSGGVTFFQPVTEPLQELGVDVF
ncbi:trypsin-like serine protease [Actinomadura barringtoniae]|uniref:Trypsin-like serine protease n=1 Tax=Actinomadura barringtoniae TaxID=1427535 RepID=A0A939P8H4_9ACTN|nr:S1 family peptidase [Actinomadura barringtoniae]MBO2447836.1 trypsin-like serine protease [Actinomadura barringtoniae]